MFKKIPTPPLALRQQLHIAAAMVGLVLLVATAIFFITAEQSPFTAELAYLEYSKDDGIVGSVVPASCESNPINNHYISGIMCQCAISASPTCSGGGCTKTISWSTTYNGSFGLPNLRANGAAIGNVALSGSMQREIPAGGQTFSLHRPDGVQLCAAFVPGPPPPSVNFVGVPAAVNLGNTVTLTWTATNVTSCTASNGWSGAKAFTGTNNEMVTPTTSPTTYTLSCTGPGGTVHRNVTVGINPPTLTFAAVPALVGPGMGSALTWNVTGATSCTGMGGWSGAKNSNNGTHSQTVTPSAVTTYTLRCDGPGGFALRTAVVSVPSGSISASSCAIPDEGSSCSSTVSWSSANFLGGPRISQMSTVFSTAASSPGAVRLVNPSNRTFTLRDSGSSFVRTASATVSCGSLSAWSGSVCRRLPVITTGPISPGTPGTPGVPGTPTGVPQANVRLTTDSIVRRDDTADVVVDINATYNVQCTLSGAASGTVNYTAGSGLTSYTFVTRPLQFVTVIKIACAPTDSPTVMSEAEALIQVTAAQFES